MKTYLFNTIDRIKQYSQKLDATAILCQKAWYVLNEDMQQEVLIFRQDGSVIVSSQGEAKKYTWEYLPQNNSVLINHTDIDGTMLNPAFMCEDILALQKDGTKECMFLIDNESDKMQKVRSIEAVNQYFAQIEAQIEHEKRKLEEAEEQMKREAEEQKKKEVEEQRKKEVEEQKKIAIAEQRRMHRQTTIQRVQQEFGMSKEFQDVLKMKRVHNLIVFMMLCAILVGLSFPFMVDSRKYLFLSIGLILVLGGIVGLIYFEGYFEKKIKKQINQWLTTQYSNYWAINGWSIDGVDIDVETILKML